MIIFIFFLDVFYVLDMFFSVGCVDGKGNHENTCFRAPRDLLKLDKA